MCEPTSIFLAATALSSAVGAYSQIQAGNAQYKAEMYNAQIADRNAQAAREEETNVQDKAAIERRRLGERVRAEKGDINAKFSAMGIDPGFGTPADLVGDTQQAYNVDRSILGRNEITDLKTLDKQVADYTDSANQSRSSAKGALTSGRLGAVGTLLGSVANVSSRWIMPGTGQVTPPAAIGYKPMSLSPALNPLNTYRPLAVGG